MQENPYGGFSDLESDYSMLTDAIKDYMKIAWIPHCETSVKDEALSQELRKDFIQDTNRFVKVIFFNITE